MRRPRFTIASLLVIVVFLAVGLAALRGATDAWDAGLFASTLGLLTFSVLLAVHRRERRRAFWLGFALFGWAYLGVSLVPAAGLRLPTTKGLYDLDSLVQRRSWYHGLLNSIRPINLASSQPPGQAVAFSGNGGILTVHGPGTVRIWDAATGRPIPGPGGTTENFVRIGHSLIALLAGFIGASLSRWLYDPSRPDAVGEPGHSPVTLVPRP